MLKYSQQPYGTKKERYVGNIEGKIEPTRHRKLPFNKQNQSIKDFSYLHFHLCPYDDFLEL